ncbi:MAG: hypothetical protein WAU70_03265 [Flavobacteriales bacterium]
MITTNLPEFVNLLNELGNVTVHDSMDGIELHIAKPVNVEDMDDLVCDALFADPVSRIEDQHGWTINMWKRDQLRASSDMRVVTSGATNKYELQHAA